MHGVSFSIPFVISMSFIMIIVVKHHVYLAVGGGGEGKIISRIAMACIFQDVCVCIV